MGGEKENHGYKEFRTVVFTEQLVCAYEREELQGEKVDRVHWLPGCTMRSSKVRNAWRGTGVKGCELGTVGISDRHLGIQIWNSR